MKEFMLNMSIITDLRGSSHDLTSQKGDYVLLNLTSLEEHVLMC